MATHVIGNATFDIELADPFLVWEYLEERYRRGYSRIRAFGDVGRKIQNLEMKMGESKVVFREMLIDRICLEGTLIPKFVGDRYEWFNYEAQEKSKQPEKAETWRDREPLL